MCILSKLLSPGTTCYTAISDEHISQRILLGHALLREGCLAIPALCISR